MFYLLLGLVILLIVLILVYNTINHFMEEYKDYNDYVCGKITREEFLRKEREKYEV